MAVCVCVCVCVCSLAHVLGIYKLPCQGQATACQGRARWICSSMCYTCDPELGGPGAGPSHLPDNQVLVVQVNGRRCGSSHDGVTAVLL